jgi:arylsulfatase A-like enzyme
MASRGRFVAVRSLAGVIAAALVLPAPAPAAELPKRPNVVLVFLDDAGYGDLGCYGNTLIRTPNLDRMAAEGVRFTDFYVAQAVCSASRAALLTGCYPNRIGIQGALGPRDRTGISGRELTIAGMLKARGYATAAYGKWHLGHLPQFLPTRHGFDDYFGLPYSNDMWPNHPTDHTYPDLPLIDGEAVVATNPDMDQLTKRYTERAVAFIHRNKDRPFFLYVPHSMPHVPLGASEQFRGKSRAGLYGDVIEELDWSFGQILAALKADGLDEKTLVIFASDNGPWLSYGPHGGSAGPLREGKGTSWEGGVREPCIVRWPGQVPAGGVGREPWMTIDVLPTLAFLTGAEPPRLPIDGKNVWPLWRGDPGARSPQEAYYFYYDRELQAVRSGRWKLHLPHAYRTLAGPPGRDGKPAPYSILRTGVALYDLSEDVGETRDVAERHPEVVERLSNLADRMRGELGDSATHQRGSGVRSPGTAQP